MALTCMHCHVGTMVEPPSKHPGYLVCDTCNVIELTYEPLDYQEPLHNVEYRIVKDNNGNDTIATQIIFVAGGYGSGKSRATLQEFFLRCLENPGGTALITAPTLQQLKRTTIKTFFNEICPPELIESYNKTEGEITLVNGCVIYTIPSDDEEKIRSINCGLVHVEEASGVKESIYVQLLTRMRDKFVKNKAIFVCTNPDMNWVKSTFIENDLRKDPKHPEHNQYNPAITNFVWATKLNKYLPPDFIENISKARPRWWVG